MERDILKPEIWNKIIKAFNKNKLGYVLVGGAALAVHGIPRSTLDMDIYIAAKAETVYRLFQISDALGLKSEQKSILAFISPEELIANQWLSFSYEGREILDVFLAEDRDFKKIFKRSILARDKDISVRVASLKDIEAMKRVSARPADIADIELIKKSKGLKAVRNR